MPDRAAEDFVSHYQLVSPTFFSTIGVPLVGGRALSERDRDTANVVGLINATFARRAFPNEDPLGKRVRIGGPDSRDAWVTIVGVVRDYRHYRPPEPMGPALYFPQTAWAPITQTVVIRVRSGNATSVMPVARDVVRASVTIGLLGGALLTRFLASLLYEVQPRDPEVFLLVALGLGAVALIAVSVPAGRATSVDPLVAMRPD